MDVWKPGICLDTFQEELFKLWVRWNCYCYKFSCLKNHFPSVLWWQINQSENDVVIGVLACASNEMKDRSSKLLTLTRCLYQVHCARWYRGTGYRWYQVVHCAAGSKALIWDAVESCRVSWLLILHQVWKANWDPERGSMWNLQCWRLWGLSEWIWIPPQVWIGVATTVGTYKEAAPDPSDLELISSAASKENPPGWFVYGNSGRKTLRFGALHFTMNGLHLNL